MSGVMGNGPGGFSGGEVVDDKNNLTLANIKKDIEVSYKYFEKNYHRYREFYILTFKSGLSEADRDNLAMIGKPPIEAPVLEAHISRLRGEFSKQEPSIDVRAAEGLTLGKIDDDYLQLMNVIQAHLNEIIFESENDNFSYDIYSDILAGGFSVAKVYTDFVNDASFMQKICIERVRNPIMCGFDPLATKSHKGDGRYCFELYPMTQEEFGAEFGEDKAKTFNFTRAVESFNWTYTNKDIKVVLVADFYVKVEEPTTLVRLADNDLGVETQMTLPEYNKLEKDWQQIEQIPVILERRKSVKTRIDRYRVCQNEKLDHKKTFYPMLPLIFIDGNSVQVQDTDGGQMEQMTRPYVYHARGAQRLLNFAMQTIGQELEDMPRNTYMIPAGAIPKQYVKQWQYPQIAGTLAYHQYDLDRPDIRYDPPQVVQRIPTPPLVQETYVGSQNTIQQILGSYDSVLGTNDKQISGVAIQQGALQSNAAAIPYLVNYCKGLQRCCEVIIHLIPLIYNTPRTIPIRLPNGKRDYQVINAPYPKIDKQKQMLQKAQEMGMGGMQEQMEESGEQEAESDEMENAIMFNYEPRDLNVKIEPGVNAHVQKQVAFELLTQAMQVSPTLAEFFNRQGLPVILESLDLPGIEALKDMVEQFQAQMESERQQQAQQPTDTDKLVQAEVMKSKLEAEARDQKTQADLMVAIGKLASMHEELELKKQELELKAKEAHIKLSMEQEQRAAQASAATIQMAIDVMKHQSDVDMQEKQMGQQQEAQMDQAEMGQ